MHPLKQKIAQVRQRARRILLLYGIGWVGAVVLGTIAIVGLFDYLVHLHDLGARVLALSAVMAALVATVWYFLRPAMSAPLGDLQIAARIERRHPQLADQLISSIEFLSQSEGDIEAGSLALRRSVVAETTAELEQIDLEDVVRPRLARKPAISLCVAVLVALGLVLLSPSSAGIALSRLVQPWGGPAWPQRNYLRFEQVVDRVAQGQPFEVRLVDDGQALPDEVFIQYRYVDQPQVEVERMQRVERQVMFARRDSVNRPFEYRAFGGDDDSMSWQKLEVVDPPAVSEFAVRLVYPEYTGAKPQSADKHVRALVGTQVEIAGKTTKPLRKLTLRLDDGTDVDAKLGADKHSFQVAFEVKQSGNYWFRLEDQEGFLGGLDRRYEIRAIPDDEPSVNIEEPNSNLFVTANAVVPLKVVAKDDLAILDVALAFARSEEEERMFTLLPAPPQPVVMTNPETKSGDRRVVDYIWNLAEFNKSAGSPLQAGEKISYYAVARDNKGQQGKSHARLLQVVTPEQLLEHLGRKQGVILDKLNQLLRSQTDARKLVSQVKAQLDKAKRLDKQTHDELQGAELTQRQVEQGLQGRNDAVRELIDQLLADLRNNRVEDSEMVERMTQLSAALQKIAEDHLPHIERGLTDALKSSQQELDRTTEKPEAQPDVKKQQEISDTLGQTGQHQDQVIAALDAQLKELARWDDARRFRSDIAQFQRDEEELSEKLRRLLPNLLNPASPDRGKTEAELVKNIQHQKDLASQFERFLARMEEMQRQLEKTDAATAGTVSDTLDEARRFNISGQMRNAARDAEKRQVGQAATLQRKIAEDLKELQRILSERPEKSLDRLVRKLKEAEEHLKNLRNEHSSLQRQMKQAAAMPQGEQRKRELERLARRQQQLKQEMERMARQLQRLQAERASKKLNDAAGNTQQAAQEGQQGNAQQAADAGEQAEKDLADAQQKLAQARQQAEMDLAFEQLSKIKDSLVSLHDRQQGVIDETQRLEGLRDPDGNLDGARKASVRQLSRTQDQIARETQVLADKLTSAEVFRLAMDGAIGEMNQATDQLAELRTDKSTLDSEQNAHRRLGQLLDALKQDKAEGGEQQTGNGDGQQGGGKPPGDGIPEIAQLKMLKFLQMEINERTRALNEQLGKQPLSDDQTRELSRLGEQQGELADLVRNLSRPQEANPEENPEALPDDFSPKDQPADQPAEPKPGGNQPVNDKDINKLDLKDLPE